MPYTFSIHRSGKWPFPADALFSKRWLNFLYFYLITQMRALLLDYLNFNIKSTVRINLSHYNFLYLIADEGSHRSDYVNM